MYLFNLSIVSPSLSLFSSPSLIALFSSLFSSLFSLLVTITTMSETKKTASEIEQLNSRLFDETKNGDEEKCRSILDEGADLTAVNEYGWTPLHYAAGSGYIHLCETFVDHYHVDVNITCNSGVTPLISACQWGHEDVARFLIDHGANVNHETEYHRSALHCAAARDFSTICELLIDCGADVDGNVLSDSKRWTPLYCAAVNHSVRTCLLLLQRDANASIISGENGYTPRQVADDCRYSKVVQAFDDFSIPA